MAPLSSGGDGASMPPLADAGACCRARRMHLRRTLFRTRGQRLPSSASRLKESVPARPALRARRHRHDQARTARLIPSRDGRRHRYERSAPGVAAAARAPDHNRSGTASVATRRLAARQGRAGLEGSGAAPHTSTRDLDARTRVLPGRRGGIDGPP